MKEENKELLYKQQAKLMSIIVEALLYTSSPQFLFDIERDELVYVNVLEQLKESNSEIFDMLELTNIKLMMDSNAKENPNISKIIQILGDRLETIDYLE